MRVTVTLSPETEAFIRQIGASDQAPALVQSWVNGYLGYHKDFIKDCAGVAGQEHTRNGEPLGTERAIGLPIDAKVDRLLSCLICDDSRIRQALQCLILGGLAGCETQSIAALAYINALSDLGLSLRYVDDGVRKGFILPPGHTPAEVELVRFLRAELRDLLAFHSQEERSA